MFFTTISNLVGGTENARFGTLKYCVFRHEESEWSEVENPHRADNQIFIHSGKRKKPGKGPQPKIQKLLYPDGMIATIHMKDFACNGC
ncbi:hypothetical protein JOD43_000769 [Pullulanibacillus pueri]|nr:hypothetical protein [Pullulanibacillus pueri]